MGSGTAGSGNDQITNALGIAQSHAYTLIGAYQLTTSSGSSLKVFHMRNPWSSEKYSGSLADSKSVWNNGNYKQ